MISMGISDMNTRRLKRLFVIVVTLALASCSANDPEQIEATNAHPNIVIILVDDLGWNDVSYHGSEISTPHIDALAQSGTRLERSYVFPICTPTRAALLTGRNPLQYGLDGPLGHGEVLPLDLKLLPQWLREAGYQTWLVGKWHLGLREEAALPNARGFDHYYGFMGGYVDYYTHVFFDGLDWQRNGQSVREEGHTTHLLTQEALALIEERDRDAPFFLYLAYNAPHTPLQTISGSPYDFQDISNPDRRVYAQMVADLDEKIGTLIDRLERDDLLDDTLIVFLSDNGGATPLGASNAPLSGGKSTAFEGGMRTPAIVSWASNLQSGRIVNEPFYVQDWTPTLLAAAGIEFNSGMFDGANAWPVIAGQTAEPQRVVMGGVNSLAAYEWPLKYIEHTPRGSTQMQTALYDVVADPGETQNIADANPEVVERLANEIARFRNNRSLAHEGPRPDSLFAGDDGRPDYNLRLQETGEPWAERSMSD